VIRKCALIRSARLNRQAGFERHCLTANGSIDRATLVAYAAMPDFQKCRSLLNGLLSK
jgi:hypothetical protein